MKLTIREALIITGRKGGRKTKKLYGKEHFIAMQKKSVESRKKQLVDKKLDKPLQKEYTVSSK